MIKKRLKSSENKIGSNRRDAFVRSITYTKKKSVPIIDSWGTLQVIYLICFTISTNFNVLLSVR